MNLSTSGYSHFSFFEILRILVPGYYCVFCFLLFGLAFNLVAEPFNSYAFAVPAFLIGGLIAGLTIYAREMPKHRKAFTTNQPSHYVLERSRRLNNSCALSETEARRLYFYILNTSMPINIHEKIFFFGTVYHCMISIRRTSFWFGMAGLMILGLFYASNGMLAEPQLLSVICVWIVYGLNVRYNKADRKMQDSFYDQIFWLSMNSELLDAHIRTYSRNMVTE